MVLAWAGVYLDGAQAAARGIAQQGLALQPGPGGERHPPAAAPVPVAAAVAVQLPQLLQRRGLLRQDGERAAIVRVAALAWGDGGEGAGRAVVEQEEVVVHDQQQPIPPAAAQISELCGADGP